MDSSRGWLRYFTLSAHQSQWTSDPRGWLGTVQLHSHGQSRSAQPPRPFQTPSQRRRASCKEYRPQFPTARPPTTFKMVSIAATALRDSDRDADGMAADRLIPELPTPKSLPTSRRSGRSARSPTAALSLTSSWTSATRRCVSISPDSVSDFDRGSCVQFVEVRLKSHTPGS